MARGVMFAVLQLAIYKLTMSSVSCDGARGNKLLERKQLSDLHFLRKQTKHTKKPEKHFSRTVLMLSFLQGTFEITNIRFPSLYCSDSSGLLILSSICVSRKVQLPL